MADRHAFRAQWHDYNAGTYFVTICTDGKKHYFGHIIDGIMHLSATGIIIDASIKELAKHHGDMEVIKYVVMPNHVHLIIAVGNFGIRQMPEHAVGCLNAPRHGEACLDNHHSSRLAVIIRNLKGDCTRKVNDLRLQEKKVPMKLWQRSFHEHIIRTQKSYEHIMEYVEFNPDRWTNDCFYG